MEALPATPPPRVARRPDARVYSPGGRRSIASTAVDDERARMRYSEGRRLRILLLIQQAGSSLDRILWLLVNRRPHLFFEVRRDLVDLMVTAGVLGRLGQHVVVVAAFNHGWTARHQIAAAQLLRHGSSIKGGTERKGECNWLCSRGDKTFHVDVSRNLNIGRHQLPDVAGHDPSARDWGPVSRALAGA